MNHDAYFDALKNNDFNLDGNYKATYTNTSGVSREVEIKGQDWANKKLDDDNWRKKIMDIAQMDITQRGSSITTSQQEGARDILRKRIVQDILNAKDVEDSQQVWEAYEKAIGKESGK